jgi:hypothetical protein
MTIMKKLIHLSIYFYNSSVLYAQPGSLHPANLHYFILEGETSVNISSGEHYGAILNPEYKDDIAIKIIRL